MGYGLRGRTRQRRSRNKDWPEGQRVVNSINFLAPARSDRIGNAVLFRCSGLVGRIMGQTLWSTAAPP
jgi:hypothetical protein